MWRGAPLNSASAVDIAAQARQCGSMTQAPSSTVFTPETPQAAAKSGLVSFIARQPGAAFAAFLALHFALWTTLPTLLYANLPLDIIEGLTYGPHWPHRHRST